MFELLINSIFGTPDLELGLNGGLDFCIKWETDTFNCADRRIRALPECKKPCENQLSVCSVPKKHKIPCSSLLNEEAKWKRKVDALETAIQLYALKGYLHNDKNVVIQAGAKLCTTDYVTEVDALASGSSEWDRIASHLVTVWGLK